MAGMGVEAGDVDGSGRPSLFVTNFQNEPNIALPQPRPSCAFQDWTAPAPGWGRRASAGWASARRSSTPTSTATSTSPSPTATSSGTREEIYGAPYAQEAQLFLGDGGGKFRDVSAAAGPYFREAARRPRPGLGRLRQRRPAGPGCPATAGRPRCCRNDTETANDWLRLELVGDGKKSNRNAIGAVVEVEWGGTVRTHFVNGGGSYLSASDRRLSLGLGPNAAKLDRVTVRWPSGRTQEYRDLPARAFWRLREGAEAAEKVR